MYMFVLIEINTTLECIEIYCIVYIVEDSINQIILTY